jgi:nucleotide-binding universal stress UspA family protein
VTDASTVTVEAKAHTTRFYLVATDGSPSSDRTLDFAVERAKESGARLLVAMAVYATPLGAPTSGGGEDVDMADALAKEARKIVAEGAERARHQGVPAEGEVITGYPGEDVSAVLVKFAEGRHVHTIFVGDSHARGILQFLIGSTAERVVELAKCHVSIVR